MKTFERYNASQMMENNLHHFMFDTIIENLQYLYDEPMDTPENRAMWLNAVQQHPSDSWHVVIAFEGGTPCGFLQYSIKDEALYIGGVHIPREYRLSPTLLRGLLTCCFESEQGKFSRVYGHINKMNIESQRNFLRFGRIVGETEKSYKIEATEAGMQMIERLCSKRKNS